MRKHTKSIMTVVIALFILSCFAGYGLYARSSGSGGEGDYAAAKINGKRIMRSTLDSTMVRIAEQMGASEISAGDWLMLRQIALDNLAVQTELEKEVKSRKIDATKEEIESAYTSTMDSFPTREAFKEFLVNSGLTEQAVKNDIKSQLQREKVVQALTSEIVVSDQDANDFYEAVKSFRYARPDGFMINIASFRSKDIAEKFRSSIAGGTSWDAALEENKGEVIISNAYDKPGEIAESEINENPALAPLKTLAMNSASPAIQLGDEEYAVIIKREKTSERLLPFEEVSNDVVTLVRGQQAENVFADLRARAKVEILDPSIFPGAEMPQEDDTDVSGDAQ